MLRFRLDNVCLCTMWPNLFMWMFHVSLNYLLTKKIVNVPCVNIVNVLHVNKSLAKCSITFLINIVIIFLVGVMPS